MMYSFCSDKACWTCTVPNAMYSVTNRVGPLSTMPIDRFDENKGNKPADVATQFQYIFVHVEIKFNDW